MAGRLPRFIRNIVFVCFALAVPATAAAQWAINDTKHNLSVTGPGDFKALNETRICVFCHTPHNGFPSSPLWNRDLANPETYTPYSSTTMRARPSYPTGPSRLCLSCHDGTVALGEVRRPSGKIAMQGAELISPQRRSYIGTNLSDDHPVSFPYSEAVANPRAGLADSYPAELVPYPGGYVQCTSCHEPHKDLFRSRDIHGKLTGKFLAMDNRFSALCTKCHSRIDGWDVSSHDTSASSVNGKLPVSPKEWPTWPTVAEWGCEECHTPHSAGGPERLFYYAEEERNCYTCHDGNVAQKNILARFQAGVPSKHPVDATTGVHDPNESPVSITSRHVECVDCHNPHTVRNAPASAPYVSGSLTKVSGMTLEGGPKDAATFEYEICFKCHADTAQAMPYILRVINNTNLRTAFGLDNPSFHPVTGMGRNPNVPSIPSQAEPALTPSSIIYCFDCHSDDTGGTKGPHGSNYAPILKYNYVMLDGTLESYDNYALCYQCHNRTSILNDDSFKKRILTNRGGHSGHLAAGAPCSACHDAHGILDNGTTGSHTNLINFDTRIVAAYPGYAQPIFNDTGLFSGNCVLVCHGKNHTNSGLTNSTYP